MKIQYVIIIPNEELMNCAPYEKTGHEGHPKITTPFFDANSIEYDEKTNLNMELVNRGCIVVNAYYSPDFRNNIVMLPEFITNKQYQILKSYNPFFEAFDSLTYGFFTSEEITDNELSAEENPNWLDIFYHEIKSHCIESRVTR